MAKKLVGMYKTIGGPQTGLQFRGINKDPVAAGASSYPRAAHSEGIIKLAIH